VHEVYWKMRWESSEVDGGEYRTVVVYKDTSEVKSLDPVEWTGTFRDDRSINAYRGSPEAELTGQTFTVNAWRHDALEVPSGYSKHRFWRNTTVSLLKEGDKAVLIKKILTLILTIILALIQGGLTPGDPRP